MIDCLNMLIVVSSYVEEMLPVGLPSFVSTAATRRTQRPALCFLLCYFTVRISNIYSIPWGYFGFPPGPPRCLGIILTWGGGIHVSRRT